MSNNYKSAKQKRDRERRRIRIATIIMAILIIAIVIVIVVSCSKKKSSNGNKPTEPVTSSAMAPDVSNVYVEPTYTRDKLEITDEWPTVGTSTDYSLQVNTALNVTIVYSRDGDGNLTPIKVLSCSTGREGCETPQGTFYLGEWIIGPDCEWCYMADGTQGLYAYRIIDGINNDIMFHSVPYYETDHGTLEYDEYNKLGNYASMGCIRMNCADVRWLGQLCAGGTEVVVYYDENEVLPMEKTPTYFIPTDIEQIRGWDPSDPVSANPWHSYTFTMEVPNSIEIASGVDDVASAITSTFYATDCYGNNVTHYMKYSGTVGTEKGKYPIIVTLDLGQYHATKDVTVIVK